MAKHFAIHFMDYFVPAAAITNVQNDINSTMKQIWAGEQSSCSGVTLTCYFVQAKTGQLNFP